MALDQFHCDGTCRSQTPGFLEQNQFVAFHRANNNGGPSSKRLCSTKIEVSSAVVAEEADEEDRDPDGVMTAVEVDESSFQETFHEFQAECRAVPIRVLPGFDRCGANGQT